MPFWNPPFIIFLDPININHIDSVLLKDDLIGPPSMLRLLLWFFFLPCQDNWIPFGRHNGVTENVHPLEAPFGKRYNVSNWINKKRTYPITRIYIFTISILWEIKCTFSPILALVRTHIRKRPKEAYCNFVLQQMSEEGKNLL